MLMVPSGADKALQGVHCKFYYALFMSHMNYCFLVWGSTTQTNINKLYLLQKKVVRPITNADYFAHSEPTFRRLNLLPIYKQYSYNLVIRYKTSIRNNQCAFIQLLHLKENLPVYSTRNKEYWNIPFCRTEYGRQMLFYAVSQLRNKLRGQNIVLERCAPFNLRQFFSM